jgi:hypothetical protein
VTALVIVDGLLVVLVALLLWGRRQGNPDVEQLIALIDRLCVRIQAPQLAAIEEVNPFSDSEYWESREALAERLMHEEVDAGSANTS